MSEILDKEQNQEVKDLFEETFGNEAKQELEKKEKKLKTLKFQHNPDAEESEFDDLGEQKDELNSKVLNKWKKLYKNSNEDKTLKPEVHFANT